MSGRGWMRYPTVAGLAIAAGVVGLDAGARSPKEASYSTPEGITVIDVSKTMDDAVPQFMWRRLGDANGNPLYTFDADPPGRSSCNADCAQDFPPLAADAKTKASGDFSIVVRDDHRRQWAYQGKPLYRFSGKDPAGEPVGARIAMREDPAWTDPASEIYTPKPGWRRAAFAPEKSTAMPSTVELAGLGAVNGFGFVDAVSRQTVYAAPVSRQLSSDWHPVRAAALELPVGEFSIVMRGDDGTLQWAYRGEALYTFAGDHAPGEVNGILTGEGAVHAALAYRNFVPQGIQIHHVQGRGPLLIDANGRTLYYVSRYQLQYGGRETREGFLISYNSAKSQGTAACEGDCTDSWQPLLAPAKARGWGFWEVVTRPDGARQWAFKGSPLYTFIGDKKPGDTAGQGSDGFNAKWWLVTAAGKAITG